MIKQRKLITLIALMSVLMLVLAACGRNDPDPTATPEPAPVEEVAAEEEVVEEEEAVEEEAVAEEEAAEEEAVEEAVEEEAVEEEAVEEEAVAEEEAAEEVAASEAMTSTEEMTATEGLTATEEIMADEVVTATDETAAGVEEEVKDAVEAVTGPSGELTLVSARQLTEIIDEKNPSFAAVSPNGAHIVWAQSGSKRRAPGQFCVYTFSNADKVCTDVPEEYQGYPYQLYWSPDSTQVAFTESPIALGLESDIWVFNAADGSFVNRTDDGVTGSYIQNESGTYALDLIPMWNSVDGLIYFWRVVPEGDSKWKVGLFSVDSDEGEAVEIRDVTDTTASHLPLYDITYISLDSVSAVSPDGTMVATIMTAMADYASTGVNLWVVNIEDDSVEPKLLMTAEDFQTAYPVWQNLPGAPMGLSWTGDSAAVVVDTFSNDTHAPLHVYYNADVTSGEVTPVVDFSSVESLDALFEPTETGIPMRYYSPWAASLSPANDSVILFSDLGGTAGVMQGILPPDGELPPMLGAADSPMSAGATRSSRSVDGKVLVYGILLTFE